jgi:hypothetical protein
MPSTTLSRKDLVDRPGTPSAHVPTPSRRWSSRISRKIGSSRALCKCRLVPFIWPCIIYQSCALVFMSERGRSDSESVSEARFVIPIWRTRNEILFRVNATALSLNVFITPLQSWSEQCMHEYTTNMLQGWNAVSKHPGQVPDLLFVLDLQSGHRVL